MFLYEEEDRFAEFGALEERNYGFFEEEDAFYLLFEELFETDSVNPKNIYEALRFLLWLRNIEPSYSKIQKMSPDNLRIEEE